MSVPNEFDVSKLRRIYDQQARFYDVTRKLFLTHRREAIALLGIVPGNTVVDIGCGTGENFRFLRQKLENDGLIIGVDASPEMLKIAQQKTGVTLRSELICMDAAEFRREEQVDAVIASYALSMIPDYRRVIRNAFGYLKPGGRFVTLDFRLSNRPGARSFNRMWRHWSGWYGGDFGREPWQDLDAVFGNCEVRQYALGFRYAAYSIKKMAVSV